MIEIEGRSSGILSGASVSRDPSEFSGGRRIEKVDG